MKRKNIIIILLVIALLLGGAAFYFLYFKKLPALPFGLGGPSVTEEIPTPTPGVVPGEKIAQISSEGAVSPIATTDGSRILYIGKNGDIFDSSFDGSDVKRTPFTPLQNLIKVLWAKDRSTFTAIYGGTGKKTFFYYNPANRQATPYPGTVAAAALSGVEDKLVYHSSDGLSGTPLIAIADLDGKNAKTVLQARLRGVDLAWISQNDIAVSTTPSGLAPNMLWLLNPVSGKLTSILSDIYGLTARWSPSGEQFLFSQTTAQGKDLSLSIANKNATSVKSVPAATLPEKCVFSRDEKSIVCAIPQIMPDIVWPDDYYKKLYEAPEQIWRIDLVSGKKDLLHEFNSSLFDAAELILSSNEDRLIFINRKNGELYSLMLK